MLVMAGLALTLFLMRQIPIRPPVTWFWVPSYQGDQLVLVLKGEVPILGISVIARQTGKGGHPVTTGYSHQDLSAPVKVSLIKVCLARHATWGHLIKNCLVCQETCLGTCLTCSLITACLLPGAFTAVPLAFRFRLIWQYLGAPHCKSYFLPHLPIYLCKILPPLSQMELHWCSRAYLGLSGHFPRGCLYPALWHWRNRLVPSHRRGLGTRSSSVTLRTGFPYTLWGPSMGAVLCYVRFCICLWSHVKELVGAFLGRLYTLPLHLFIFSSRNPF